MVKLVELVDVLTAYNPSTLDYTFVPHERVALTALVGGTDKNDRQKWQRKSIL